MQRLWHLLLVFAMLLSGYGASLAPRPILPQSLFTPEELGPSGESPDPATHGSLSPGNFVELPPDDLGRGDERASSAASPETQRNVGSTDTPAPSGTEPSRPGAGLESGGAASDPAAAKPDGSRGHDSASAGADSPGSLVLGGSSGELVLPDQRTLRLAAMAVTRLAWSQEGRAYLVRGFAAARPILGAVNPHRSMWKDFARDRPVDRAELERAADKLGAAIEESHATLLGAAPPREIQSAHRQALVGITALRVALLSLEEWLNDTDAVHLQLSDNPPTADRWRSALKELTEAFELAEAAFGISN